MAKCIREAWKEKSSGPLKPARVMDKSAEIQALRTKFRNKFPKEQAVKEDVIASLRAARDSRKRLDQPAIPNSWPQADI